MTLFRSDALAGKRILVTGGGTGLGKEISLGFAAHGGHVFICGRREAVLKTAVEQIRAETGGPADYAAVNVRDAASVEAMVADIWQSDPLTGLVNNAAANFIAPTETISPRGYEAIRSTVMDGSSFATLACGKRWIAGGLPGVVVSNLVTWVWTGSAYVVPSAMAKSAVQAMTMSLAVEWGPKNIRLNAIAPGPSRPKMLGKNSIQSRTPQLAQLSPIRCRSAAMAEWKSCAICLCSFSPTAALISTALRSRSTAVIIWRRPAHLPICRDLQIRTGNKRAKRFAPRRRRSAKAEALERVLIYSAAARSGRFSANMRRAMIVFITSTEPPAILMTRASA